MSKTKVRIKISNNFLLLLQLNTRRRTSLSAYSYSLFFSLSQSLTGLFFSQKGGYLFWGKIQRHWVKWSHYLLTAITSLSLPFSLLFFSLTHSFYTLNFFFFPSQLSFSLSLCSHLVLTQAFLLFNSLDSLYHKSKIKVHSKQKCGMWLLFCFFILFFLVKKYIFESLKFFFLLFWRELKLRRSKKETEWLNE